jgi:hypothetical protein
MDTFGYATAGAVAIESHSQWTAIYLMPTIRLTIDQVREIRILIPTFGAMKIKAKYDGNANRVLLYECAENESNDIIVDFRTF